MEIRPLSADERRALDATLDLAARSAGGRRPLSAAEVQELYETVAADRPDDVEAQILVGLAFGDLVAGAAGYEWVRVIDGFGEETALSPPGVELAAHPITMIQKRLAAREPVDIADLRDGTIDLVDRGVESGRYPSR